MKLYQIAGLLAAIVLMILAIVFVVRVDNQFENIETVSIDEEYHVKVYGGTLDEIFKNVALEYTNIVYDENDNIFIFSRDGEVNIYEITLPKQVDFTGENTRIPLLAYEFKDTVEAFKVSIWDYASGTKTYNIWVSYENENSESIYYDTLEECLAAYEYLLAIK
jgi:SHS2 domain-containing protein